MERARILVIEDNHDTRLFLETVLSREFDVICTENAVLGIDYARNKRPDLIVLDIMMPILNGFDACGLLKKDDTTRNIPIIFLSAKNTVSDITQGLGAGGDDYLAKPFDYKELVARIKVRLREKASWRTEPKVLIHGDLKLVLDTRDTIYAGKRIDLTQTEFDILRLLVQSAGQVVTRDQIIQEVWRTPDAAAQKRTIDVHIRALRKRFRHSPVILFLFMVRAISTSASFCSCSFSRARTLLRLDPPERRRCAFWRRRGCVAQCREAYCTATIATIDAAPTHESAGLAENALSTGNFFQQIQ